MSTVLSQPIYRDALINGKFLAGLTTIAVMLASIIVIILVLELIVFGIIPTIPELARIGLFFILCIIYIGFCWDWEFFSIVFKQTATSVLVLIMVWISFSFFILIVAYVIADQIAPVNREATLEFIARNQEIRSVIMRISSLILFQKSTTAILNSSIRIFGITSALRSQEVIPSPLRIGQSLLVAWSQFISLIALILICFAISYVVFIRLEIHST